MLCLLAIFMGFMLAFAVNMLEIDEVAYLLCHRLTRVNQVFGSYTALLLMGRVHQYELSKCMPRMSSISSVERMSLRA